MYRLLEDVKAVPEFHFTFAEHPRQGIPDLEGLGEVVAVVQNMRNGFRILNAQSVTLVTDDTIKINPHRLFAGIVQRTRSMPRYLTTWPCSVHCAMPGSYAIRTLGS